MRCTAERLWPLSWLPRVSDSRCLEMWMARLVRIRRTPRVARNAGEKLHGIKFSYSLQKDAYADLEFMNDVGRLAG